MPDKKISISPIGGNKAAQKLLNEALSGKANFAIEESEDGFLVRNICDSVQIGSGGGNFKHLNCGSNKTVVPGDIIIANRFSFKVA